MKLTNQEFASRYDGKIDELQVVKSSKDNNGIYTVVSYKRKSTGTLYMTSTLSAPNMNGQYTVRTEKYYGTNGTSQIDTITYALSYDTDGDLISEV